MHVLCTTCDVVAGVTKSVWVVHTARMAMQNCVLAREARKTWSGAAVVVAKVVEAAVVRVLCDLGLRSPGSSRE